MSNSVNLSLDVTKTGIQNPLIKVRQGDGGFETLHTTVTSNGEPLDLQGWTITFMGTTAGNHKVIDANVKVVEAPNGIFDYTPSKAWGMDIGDFKMAYFKFVKGDGSASSANFRVSVIEAVDLTQDEAKNYISVVDATIADVRQRLTSSLASVTASVAATSSAASSMAVYVSSTASSAVSQVNSAASSASSVASSAAAKVSGVAAQVNSLSVGGRNLLLGTGISFTGIGDGSVNGNFDAQGGKYYLAGGKKVSDLYNRYGASGYLTLSFDWVASGSAISGSFNPQWDNTPWGAILNNVTIQPSITNNSGRYKVAIPLSNSGYSTGFARALMFRQDNLQGNITISNVKLEAGNIATDWTPAPEDADNTYVNKSGDTMTGGLKGGQTNLPASGDLNTLTDTGKYYQNMNFKAANWTNRPSNAPNLAFSVDVIGQADQSLTTQVYYVHTTSRMWVRTMWLDGTIKSSPWVELANDANVVHNTGTETISGDKTFTGKVSIPAATSVATSIVSGTNGISFKFRRTGNVVHVEILGNYTGTGWTGSTNPSYAAELFNVVVPVGFAPNDWNQSAIIEYGSAVGFGRYGYDTSSKKMTFTYRGMVGSVGSSNLIISSVTYMTSEAFPG